MEFFYILEDREARRDYFRNLFSNTDYKFKIFENNSELLKNCKLRNPSFIISRLEIASKDDFRLINEILKSTDNIPIIFYSSEFKEFRSKIDSQEDQIIDFLKFPFDEKILFFRINSVLKIKKKIGTFHKDKKISLKKYYNVFDNSPLPMWEEDFSETIKIIKQLKLDKKENLEEFLKRNPEIIKKLTRSIKVIEVNKKAIELVEAKDKKEIIDNLNIIFGEKSLDVFRKEIVALAEGKKHFEGEGINYTITGRKLNVFVFWHLEDNEKVHLIIKDITEQKKFQLQLKRLSAAVKQSDSSIAITDIDGNLIYVNPHFLHQNEYTEKEVLGENPSVMKSGEMPNDCYKKLWEKITSGKSWHGEFHNKKKSGELYWEKAHISPIFDENNQIINYLKIGNDITSQKIEYERLKTTIKLTDNLTEGVWILNAKTDKMLYINPKLEEIYQKKYEDWLENPSIFNDLVHPDDKNEYLIKTKKIFKEKIDVSLSYRIQREDNSILQIESKIIPILDEDNEISFLCGIIRDISDEKIIKQQLYETLNTQKNIMESVDYGILLINPETRSIVKHNETALKMISPENNNLLEIDPSKIFKFKNQQKSSFCDTTKSIKYVECKLSTNKIADIPLLLTKKMIKINNKPHVLLSFTDITKQKLNEKRIESSREKYKSIINNMQEVYFQIDNNGIITFIGPSALDMFNYDSILELQGKSFYDLFFSDKENVSIFQEDVKTNSGRIKNFESIFKKKNNENIFVLLSTYPLFNKKNEKIGLGGVITDISIRKKNEIELQKKSKLQKLLMNISKKYINIPVDEINKSISNSLKEVGIFLKADRAYIFSYDLEENTASNTYEWVSKGVSPQIQNLQKEKINREEPIVNAHLNNKQYYFEDVKDLKDSPLKENFLSQNIKSLMSSPLVIERKCIGFVGFDWTRKKHHFIGSEKRLLGLFAQLIVNINLRKRSEENLEIEKKKAIKANKAKSEFLANMSHEIRTPLNGVIGFIELLNETKLSNFQKEYLKNSQISAYSLLDIINDILDLSKIEAGKLEIEIIKSDILKTIEEAIDVIKLTTTKKNLELLLNIDPNIPKYAYIDAIRLKQILINLLNNAAKFTPKGQIELEVKFTKIDDKNGKFYFAIKDTGIGINKNQLKKLFKAFSQADSSTTRKFGGTGLGLIISSLLAEKMDSQINVKSTVDVGTTFYFEIETKIENSKNKDKKVISKINKILIVDDNVTNRKILENIFKHWNISTKSCEDGIEAISTLKNSNDFDLAVIDYKMPDKNGLQTISSIRKDLKINEKKLPIILLHSSIEDKKIHSASKDLNITYNLEKPLKMNDLRHYLEQISNDEISSEKEKSQNTNENQPISLDHKKILIAEDIQLNMLLVEQIIQKFLPNAEIIQATNGKEAFTKRISTNPDIILMDVQMPEMDGVEATEKIRLFEKKTDSFTPIIALTAGALKSEKSKVFDAGMNDFLTKPISKIKIKNCLQKWLFNKKTEDIRNLNVKKTKIFNKDKFEEDKDPYLIKELYKITKNNIFKNFANLNEAHENANFKEAKRFVHSLKGLAANLYLERLKEISSEVEEKYINNQIEEAENLFSELKNECDNAIKIIEIQIPN